MLEELKKYIKNEKNLSEEFIKNIKPNDKIILWGNGWALYWYCKFFKWKEIKPDFIIDKNIHYGQRFDIPIVSADYILENLNVEQCKFVITAPKYRDEIETDIINKFGNVQIYSFEAEIYFAFIQDVESYRNYLLDNFIRIESLYSILEDDKSKETLISFFKGRISGEQKFFIDCMIPNQYFPKDIKEMREEYEIIVEAGSNDGKTLLEIIEETKGKFKKIFCFEPDKECIVKLEEIIDKSNKPIQLIKKGVGNIVGKVYFKTDSKYGASRIVDEGNHDYFVDITTIDEELEDVPINYIKMDIEGMELDCLKGAKKVITKYSPKLAICIYHKNEDILEIPEYLKGINPNYKFYLRHHNWGATETVLYAHV